MNPRGNILAHPMARSFYLPVLLYSIAEGIAIPILPLFVSDLSFSYTVIGLILAGDAIGTLLSDVPAGMLVRRTGAREIMMLGMGVAAGSTGLLFFTQSAAILFLLRIVAGLGKSLFVMGNHAYLSSSVVTGGRGRSIALYGGTRRLGIFVGPLAGGSIARYAGLGEPFLVYGAVGLGVMAALWVLMDNPEMPPAHDSSSGHGPVLSVLQSEYRVLSSAGAAQFFGQMIRAGRNIIVPLYASTALGLDPQQVGVVVGLSWGVDMLFFYPAGWLMDNWGRKYAIVPCFAIQSIMMAMVPLAGSFWGLLLITSVMGLGNGLGSGTMMTLGADLAPPDLRGEFLGLWHLIGDAGRTGAPIIVGGIANMFVLPVAATAMSGAGFVAVVLFAFFVPETRRGERGSPEKFAAVLAKVPDVKPPDYDRIDESDS